MESHPGRNYKNAARVGRPAQSANPRVRLESHPSRNYKIAARVGHPEQGAKARVRRRLSIELVAEGRIELPTYGL